MGHLMVGLVHQVDAGGGNRLKHHLGCGFGILEGTSMDGGRTAAGMGKPSVEDTEVVYSSRAPMRHTGSDVEAASASFLGAVEACQVPPADLPEHADMGVCPLQRLATASVVASISSYSRRLHETGFDLRFAVTAL